MSFQPNNAIEEQFRQFLQEPETQDAIRGDQEKEIKIMKKMEEFESLHELTGQREQLAVALQDLDAESQRLIYPILRLKMVQHILFAALKETRKNGTSFVMAIRKPSLMRMLEKVRDELNNDPENAKRIEGEWFHNMRCNLEAEEAKKPKKGAAGAACDADAANNPVGGPAADQREPQVQGEELPRGADDVHAGLRWLRDVLRD